MTLPNDKKMIALWDAYYDLEKDYPVYMSERKMVDDKWVEPQEMQLVLIVQLKDNLQMLDSYRLIETEWQESEADSD